MAPARRVQPAAAALGFLLAVASLLLTGLAISADFGATAIFCVFLGAKFFSMFGVPTTTFVIPNELFPQHVRASCNGLSAAAGKVGAFSGSFIFPYIYDDLGIAYIFYFSAVTALCGVACTLCFYRPRHRRRAGCQEPIRAPLDPRSKRETMTYLLPSPHR